MIGAAEAGERALWAPEQVRAALDELLARGVSRPEAASQLTALSGWQRSDIYKLGLGSE